MKIGWVLLGSAGIFSGCVFDLTNDDGGRESASLWVEPSEVTAGSRSVVTVSDDYGAVDFTETWDVRSLGDFEVVEWEGHADSLDVVVDVQEGTTGGQVLSIDLPSQTVFASFDAR